ncbi:MAG TPA: L-threonylcarbamoyladenylate synthase [Thermoanaerobaculia bacterium]|nr:L-threonylcarbamoyladenylate synthase [Thermoanaerobaculia bacterium]
MTEDIPEPAPVNHWDIRDKRPSDEILDQIAATFHRGGVVILPTDTIYGLHARAGDNEGVDRVRQLKKRDAARPMVVLAADVDQCIAAGAIIESSLRATLENIWPAPLTAIVPASSSLVVNRDQATIAVRVPDIPWLVELMKRTGPLASSSLNESGQPPICSLDELPSGLRNGVDGIVEAGPLNGKPSTLVDFTPDEPRLVRAGAFPFAQKLWKRPRKTL